MGLFLLRTLILHKIITLLSGLETYSQLNVDGKILISKFF